LKFPLEIFYDHFLKDKNNITILWNNVHRFTLSNRIKNTNHEVFLLTEESKEEIAVAEFVFKSRNGKLIKSYCCYKQYIPKEKKKNEINQDL
jgi:Cft2 family RNA processing exonuclease